MLVYSGTRCFNRFHQLSIMALFPLSHSSFLDFHPSQRQTHPTILTVLGGFGMLISVIVNERMMWNVAIKLAFCRYKAVLPDGLVMKGVSYNLEADVFVYGEFNFGNDG